MYQSSSTNNRAVTAADNTNLEPVIGIVLDKPTTTTCTVILHGIYALSVSRGKFYLGAGGSATTTGPTTGFLQSLGVSFGNGDIFINPEYNRVKRF